MDFLVQPFTFLGIEFPPGMVIVVGALAVYILYLWKTG